MYTIAGVISKHKNYLETILSNRMWRNFEKKITMKTKSIDPKELSDEKNGNESTFVVWKSWMRWLCVCIVCEKNNMFDICIDTTVYNAVRSLQSHAAHSAQQKYRYFMLKMEYTSLTLYSAISVHWKRSKNNNNNRKFKFQLICQQFTPN